jgi:hypothetical protein
MIIIKNLRLGCMIVDIIFLKSIVSIINTIL